MSEPEPIGIQEARWRQFSALPLSLAKAMAEDCGFSLSDEDRIVVCSHDCDVTHDSFELEPFVQLVPVRRILEGSRDPNFYFGKSPRRFQFDSAGDLYEILVHELWTVDRKRLIGNSPDPSFALTVPQKKQLARWLAKRYFRAAFPDEFNRRLRPAMRKIEKLFKEGGEHISGVFLTLKPQDELSPDEEYSVIMKATIEVDSHSNEAWRLKAEQTIYKVVQEINEKCDGVNVLHATLTSEADFSIDDLRLSLDWTIDSFSLRSDPEEALAPTA